MKRARSTEEQIVGVLRYKEMLLDVSAESYAWPEA